MFGKEPPRAYLNHVAMIESKIQSQNTQPYNRRVQLPATLFNRSPLRQRFGPNLGQNVKVSPSKRVPTGLSPLRTRRLDNNMLNSGQTQQMPAANLGRVTSREKDLRSQTRKGYCENHQGKVASYVVTANTEYGEYCEKCAILLASQGFKVVKMEDRPLKMMNSNGGNPIMEIDNPMRRAEISHFIEELKQTTVFIRDKKDQIESQLAKSQDFYCQQQQQIINYYGMIISCLQNHKVKSLQGLNNSKANSESLSQSKLQMLEQAYTQCQEMRSDIFSSIDAIKRAEQKSFRPVMEMYQERSQKLRHQTDQIYATAIQPQRLIMNEPAEVARNLLDSIEIGFEDINAYVAKQPSMRQKKTSVYFSFDNQQREQEEPIHNEVKNVMMTETAQAEAPIVDLEEKAGVFDPNDS